MKDYGKTKIGDSATHKNPKPKKGWSVWIEEGVYFTAPTIDPCLFYDHDYAGNEHCGSCRCGCQMGSSSSSGPVDPFGACPIRDRMFPIFNASKPEKKKPKLNLYVWNNFCPDYSDGLAFAIADTLTEAKKMIEAKVGRKITGWGDVTICNLKDKTAEYVFGGS